MVGCVFAEPRRTLRLWTRSGAAGPMTTQGWTRIGRALRHRNYRLLFAGLSQRLVGSEMLAVRLPAVLFSAGLLTSLYVLTARVWKSERLALGAVAAALSLPVIAAGGTLMTIDAPYTCCWGWARRPTSACAPRAASI